MITKDGVWDRWWWFGVSVKECEEFGGPSDEVSIIKACPVFRFEWLKKISW